MIDRSDFVGVLNDCLLKGEINFEMPRNHVVPDLCTTT